MIAGLLLSATVAHAASYDPKLTWRTLQTEHFNITFHGGEEQLAQELGDLVEGIYDEMTAELAWAPRRRTEVVLVDNTDSANGYAMTLPVNTIVIYVTAPEAGSTLSLYEDWADAIFTHEYVHILHLDTIEGLPRIARAVMGRIISVNQISPGWIVEGQATFQETRHTNGGRGRSPYVDMIKRVTILADQFPPLGNMDGWQTDPPGGNLRYLFGQDFMQYVSDRTGEQVWTDWNHTYGGGIPYLLPGQRVFGERLVPLYEDWKADLTAQYQQQRDEITAAGLTPFELLSDGEDYCAAPTYSPDGQRLVWSCSDPHTGANIFLARGDGAAPEIELAGRFATDFTWRSDSKAFAYSGRRVVNRFNLYSDVNLYTIGGPTVALTSGDRARDPTFSPDGSRLVVVTNAAQNNDLLQVTVDQRREPLTDNTDHTQYYSPRFSPDGRHMALAVWSDGRQDLWLYTAEGDAHRRLTMDTAADLDPWFSADGRTLFFSSDRTGVFNIYAIDLEDEHLWQVTNVIGGAFRPVPSPSMTALVFEYYDVNGANIARMLLDRSQWRDRGRLPLPITDRAPLTDALPLSPLPLPPPPTFPSPDEEEEESAEPTKPRSRRGLNLSRGEAPIITEPYRFPGLTGVGGAYQDLARLPGPWGLPGEVGPTGGEFVSDQPTSGPDSDVVETLESEAPEEEEYPFTHPVGRYNPLPTLLPPRFISPALYQTAFGFQGTLSTSGTDTLRRYLYSAFLSYRTDSRYIGYGASLSINKWIPVISAGFYTYTVPFSDLYLTNGAPDGGGTSVPSIYSANYRYWDKRQRGYLQVTYPRSAYQTIFARWDASIRSPWFVPNEAQGIERGEALPENAYRPFLPTRGLISSIGGGWRYARGLAYSKSISPEQARVVSVLGSISSPYIGSFVLDDTDEITPFTQALLTAEWREYKTVPWPEKLGLRNHVFA
ncbi:MAG: Tol biopolymer transport system component, partial [Myxococcota bacterium]